MVVSHHAEPRSGSAVQPMARAADQTGRFTGGMSGGSTGGFLTGASGGSTGGRFTGGTSGGSTGGAGCLTGGMSGGSTGGRLTGGTSRGSIWGLCSRTGSMGSIGEGIYHSSTEVRKNLPASAKGELTSLHIIYRCLEQAILRLLAYHCVRLKSATIQMELVLENDVF
jgi:hypothetical protein